MFANSDMSESDQYYVYFPLSYSPVSAKLVRVPMNDDSFPHYFINAVYGFIKFMPRAPLIE